MQPAGQQVVVVLAWHRPGGWFLVTFSVQLLGSAAHLQSCHRSAALMHGVCHKEQFVPCGFRV